MPVPASAGPSAVLSDRTDAPRATPGAAAVSAECIAVGRPLPPPGMCSIKPPAPLLGGPRCPGDAAAVQSTGLASEGVPVTACLATPTPLGPRATGEDGRAGLTTRSGLGIGDLNGAVSLSHKRCRRSSGPIRAGQLLGSLSSFGTSMLGSAASCANEDDRNRGGLGSTHSSVLMILPRNAVASSTLVLLCGSVRSNPSMSLCTFFGARFRSAIGPWAAVAMDPAAFVDASGRSLPA